MIIPKFIITFGGVLWEHPFFNSVVNIVNDRNRVVYHVYTTCRHFDLPVNYGIYIYIYIYIYIQGFF